MLRAIAAHLNLGLNTVSRYLASPTFPERPDNRNRGKSRSGLEEHKAYLLECWKSGQCQGKVLWEQLQARGCKASYGAVSRFLRCLKEAGKAQTAPEIEQPSAGPKPNARSATWTVLRRPEQRSDDDEDLLNRLRGASPALTRCIELSEEFCRSVRTRLAENLEDWLERALQSALPALVRFARGLREDFEAVKAAMSSPWSNGQVEGQVNRLKMLKRQMYGRAGMDLLSRRFLLTA